MTYQEAIRESRPISPTTSNHLYWLGRYFERALTTLKTFSKCYDEMIDSDSVKEHYQYFCKQIGMQCPYSNAEEFVRDYLFHPDIPNSIRTLLERAYDNAVVMRNTISTEALSYVELALFTLKNNENSSSPLLSLQPVFDYILAFWGLTDDCIQNDESRNILKLGRRLERLDLYLRLGSPQHDILEELRLLRNRLHRISLEYNSESLNTLTAMLGANQSDEDSRRTEIALLESLIQI